MKTLLIVLSLIVGPLVSAEEVSIPSGRLEVVVSHGEKPFLVAGQNLKSGEDAASLLTYICRNWSLEDKPVLVVTHRTKALMPGEDVLMAAITKLSKDLGIRVFHMPPPRGSIPHQWYEAGKLTERWQKSRNTKESTKTKAQQGVAPQSATRSESKSEGKKKSKTESEERSR